MSLVWWHQSTVIGFVVLQLWNLQCVL